ncbi:signal transduction histidine kinase [Novosphingobium aromaticivorans DSM 12444]|uniref:histidine kinase n=1 Tax=Novosphingobium aromaticivorans (strain ATCC 700278 / DSM 12444 / CCUG 56034 / CIP 105152 / NBRC 16084 / F199) TaxID=279238 RepID=Q2GB38_NOVAD|nr:CHASE domain-containing protein [Novosphingobium aromaticivorans]ABD24935.1 signal transduction histidine kinase [Novosphingobium aromaticivorans DSM 12444]SCY94460.1 signal transduction histidine kinase [Novosphingobium aromaticivorans]
MEKLLSGKKLTPRWYERFPRGVPLGIFGLTMAVTMLSVFAIENAEYRRQTAQTAQTAQAVASGLERRSNANAAYLRSSAALFATQQMVEAPLFRTFIRQLHLDGRYVGSDGIGWAMKVYRDDIPTVEAIMRDGGNPGFAVRPTPEPERPFVVPVMFLEPDTPRNRRAIGFDMFSEGVRRTAMKAAERTGQPTASGHVVLQQEGRPDGLPGFLVYMPVYTLQEDGPRKLRGFVYSPFNAQRFLESSIDVNHLDGAGVRLYDEDAGGLVVLASVAPAEVSGRVIRRPIDISGHRFMLEIEAPATAMLSVMSVMTLLFGLLVATLLLVLARLLTQQAVEDRIALAWFEQQSSIRNSLTRELNHRVKNTLANVLSIISLTRRRATSLPEFADSLEGRIRALSATHDLLTQSDWGTTPIELVIRAELAPYAGDTQRHVEMGGPEVELAPNDALSLGLAIHELATNAAKYGALSVEKGRVSVRWELAGEGQARIEWVERGGPPIDQETKRKRGFGTELIEKIVAHELRSPVDLRFETEGVRCKLLVPVRRKSDFAIRQGRA